MTWSSLARIASTSVCWVPPAWMTLASASITASRPRYVPLMALFPAKCMTASSERYSLKTSRRPLFHASAHRRAVAAFGCSVIADLQACVRVYTPIPHRAAPLGPERVDRVLVIGQGPVLGELPVRVDPVGLGEHHVQVPVIAVRRDPGEDPAVRIVGEDILRLAPQAPAGQVPDLPEVLKDRVPPAVVAAEGVVSPDVPDDIFGEVLPVGVPVSPVEQRDCLADETGIRMLSHDVPSPSQCAEAPRRSGQRRP